MAIRLEARPVLQITPKAAQVRLLSGKVLWFPLSQCPELTDFTAGDEGEFTCPRWIYEREDLHDDAAASSRMIALQAQTMSFTQEAAFVRFRGGEEAWLPFDECPGLLDIPVHARGAFQCPELLLNDKELMHYAYTPEVLAHELRKGTLSLAQVIASERVDASALHQFAHDCAHQLLQRNAQMDTSVMLCLWKALQCKRQWMVDPDKLDCLTRERKEIYDMWGTLDHHHMRVAAAVWDATELDPYLAAERAARHVPCGHLAPTVTLASLRRGQTQDQELLQARQWQCNHLATLIDAAIRQQANDDLAGQRQAS